jgi:hypothetical protein
MEWCEWRAGVNLEGVLSDGSSSVRHLLFFFRLFFRRFFFFGFVVRDVFR